MFSSFSTSSSTNSGHAHARHDCLIPCLSAVVLPFHCFYIVLVWVQGDIQLSNMPYRFISYAKQWCSVRCGARMRSVCVWFFFMKAAGTCFPRRSFNKVRTRPFISPNVLQSIEKCALFCAWVRLAITLMCTMHEPNKPCLSPSFPFESSEPCLSVAGSNHTS